jgi:hypothetical protein
MDEVILKNLVASVSQEIPPSLLWNPKVHNRFLETLPLVHLQFEKDVVSHQHKTT